MLRSYCALLPLAFLSTGIAQAQDAIPLRLLQHGHDALVSEVGPGVFEVRTTGSDPYVLTEEAPTPFDHERLCVFSFDAIAPEGLAYFEVFFGPPWRNHQSGPIEPTADWTTFAANLSRFPSDVWGDFVTDFRIDFGNTEGRVVRVRNIQIRAMTPAEAAEEQARRREEQRALEALQARIEQTLIAPAGIADTSSVIAGALDLSDQHGTTRIVVLGRELDLAYQLREFADAMAPPAPLSPWLVVGEGRSAINHTLVRVLNPVGISEVQFLAYPPHVRGGVQVAAGRLMGDAPCIATAPLTDDDTREVRVFSRAGNLLRVVPIDPAIRAPYALAVGDFMPERPGDEIALASGATAAEGVALVVLSATGEDLSGMTVAADEGDGRAVCIAPRRGPDGDSLVVHIAGASGVWLCDAARRTQEYRDLGLGPEVTGVFESVALGRPFAATVAEPDFSHITRIDDAAQADWVDVGARENLFFFNKTGYFENIPEGRYVRHASFAHIRTDFSAPVVEDPDFARTDEAYWAGPPVEARAAQVFANYDSIPPGCWEPCFTHRWFAGLAQRWAQALDEETGLPRYTLLNRENTVGMYGEFGQTNAFVSGSYAPGLAAVEALYTYPLRAHLRELVRRFRGNPDHFVCVEPNHEMEINAESETTHGDYNPQMIRAFYHYLVGLYGGLDSINEVFGTPFSMDRFDAPRGIGRGEWDAYSTENSYYMVWMRFLNYVIYRVVAGTYREALLAGFPPEAIKCHQIPDHYAIASLTAFSKPAQRITPIDWNLNAGVGYGCTRYGVWFNQESNCVQGAHSSGFDAIVLGEYQSLVPDADLAYQQLRYMQDHGVQFIHAMTWPEEHDHGFNEAQKVALERLVAEDRPRLNQTGGTGQVRAVRNGDRAFDIVSLGTQARNTGLLKSITPDGAWEGSVYVVPFHAHVDIEPLADQSAADLGETPLLLGPFDVTNAGQVVDIALEARGGGTLTLRVFHHGIEMEALRTTVGTFADWRHVRLQTRVQIDMDDLRLELSSAGDVALRDLIASRHIERTTKLKHGIFSGIRHEGGVTFDAL